MKKFLIFPTFLSLLLLSGCGSWAANQKKIEQKANPPVVQNTMPTGEETAPMVKMNCDQLGSVSLKNQCIAAMNSVVVELLSQEIIGTYDSARCATLPPFLKQNCEDTIAASGMTGAISIEQYEVFQKAIAPVQPETVSTEEGTVPSVATAELKYDASQCAALDEASGLQTLCQKIIAQNELQMQLQQVVQSGNVKGCDDFQDDVAQQCKAHFGIFDQPSIVSPVETPPSPEDI